MAVDRQQRLLELLAEHAMISGKEMKLVSGKTSTIYFDMKMAMFQSEAMSLIADELLAVLVEDKATAIGGLELGAVPLVAAVVSRSYPDYPIDGFVVRKSVKEHGTQKKIEGRFDPNAAIVILDDVTTSGGSTLDAVQAVRDTGGVVKSCVTIVDREEGAVERLKEEGLTLHALFTKSDFQS